MACDIQRELDEMLKVLNVGKNRQQKEIQMSPQVEVMGALEEPGKMLTEPSQEGDAMDPETEEQLIAQIQ